MEQKFSGNRCISPNMGKLALDKMSLPPVVLENAVSSTILNFIIYFQIY